MANIIQDIGKGIEVVGKDTKKVAEDVFIALPKVITVLSTAIKDNDEVKGAVLGLVSNAAPVIADVEVDILSKGLNLPSDLATIQALWQFAVYFKSEFLPVIESVYEQIDVDINGNTKVL